MMNRSNRSLLFGARATAGGDTHPTTGATGTTATTTTQDAEALEADNQASLEHLRGSAGIIKDVAITVDASVNDHNRILDKMDKRFDGANSLVSNTLASLSQMVNDRPATRMCTIVAVFFVALLVLFRLVKH